MIEANTYAGIIGHLDKFFKMNFRAESTARVIGLLFAPPHSEFADKAIVPRMNWYHVRADYHLFVYCVGYGAYLPKDEFPDLIDATKIQGVTWQYSDIVFDELRKEIQKRTKWKYSGEVDFLLVTAVWDAKRQQTEIDFSQSMVIVPDQAILDKAIKSFSQLFERLCDRLENANRQISTTRISDLEGLRLLAKEVLDSLIEQLPSLLRSIWKKGLHFKTTDLRR